MFYFLGFTLSLSRIISGTFNDPMFKFSLYTFGSFMGSIENRILFHTGEWS